MTQEKSGSNLTGGQQEHKSEEELAKERAGKDTDKSSHDHMSRVSAEKGEGKGGGAKQKEKH